MGGDANFQNGCAIPILLAKNCMKIKEFGPPGEGSSPWCPFRSATVLNAAGHRDNLR